MARGYSIAAVPRALQSGIMGGSRRGRCHADAARCAARRCGMLGNARRSGWPATAMAALALLARARPGAA